MVVNCRLKATTYDIRYTDLYEKVFENKNVNKYTLRVSAKSNINVSYIDDRMRQRPVNAEVFDLTAEANRAGLEIIINPPEDYSVSGHVRDAQGNPVHRTLVHTYTTCGQPWWTWTDDNRAFCLEGLDEFGKTFSICVLRGRPGWC